jgi:hypothetical protein
MRPRNVATVAALVLASTSIAFAKTPAPRIAPLLLRSYGSVAPLAADGRPDRTVAPAALYAALAKLHKVVPSFSRQTGLACSSCHYQFLQLTPFGRLFKLNGYTLTGIPTISQPGDTAGHETLKLLTVPPIAAMAVASFTQLSKAAPPRKTGPLRFRSNSVCSRQDKSLPTSERSPN